MDVPTLIREILSLNPSDYRSVMDAVRDHQESEAEFEIPPAHLDIIEQRLKERDADPGRGEPWEVVRKRLGWDS
jgi:hypothetical protein